MYYALNRNSEKKPKVSLVLLDWSVRESFHLLHYLGLQNVDRGLFEVIVVEYYSKESEAVKRYEQQVDSWAILEMPDDCYYHKHLMYNVGIVLSHGEIVVICDSDAMVRETFIQTIVREFEKDRNIVLHLDQFRNMRKDFYPFNFPSFSEVMGQGCINNVGGKTRGLVDIEDPLHSRNYGACMCATRKDLLAIGGADEHIDYLGHICGPYEMTFRLVNRGLREIWHKREFLYHTWHPGEAGVKNYLGPHDGKHMSTTALEALISERIEPLTENEAVRRIRKGERDTGIAVESQLINENRFRSWKVGSVRSRLESARSSGCVGFVKNYKGFRIEIESGQYCANPLIYVNRRTTVRTDHEMELKSNSLEGLQREIDKKVPPFVLMACFFGMIYFSLWLAVGQVLKKGVSLLSRAFDGSAPEGRRLNLTARSKQFMSRIKDLSSLTSDVVVSLYLLSKNEAFVDGDGDFEMVTDSKMSKYYYMLMKSLGVSTRIRVVSLTNRRQVKEYLDNLIDESWNTRPILIREVFIYYYALMSTCQIRGRALII
jgi:hypothetical protein